MIYKTIDLTNRLPMWFLEELSKKLFYINEHILSFDVTCVDDYITTITFACDQEIDLDSYVDELIKKDFVDRHYYKEKIVWQATTNNCFYTESFKTLEEKGIIFINSAGVVTIGEPLLSLYRYIDSKIKNYCCNELNAKEYLYPTMVKTEVVEKCGYFYNSPQYIFTINRLKEDLYKQIDFINEYKKKGHIPNNPDYYSKDNLYCLPPTICYHTYDQLENTILKNNAVYTARGKAFRFESKYASKLERLYDFTIRETVFFGDMQFVSQIRKNLLEFIKSLVDELKLVGHMKSANDPFFLDPNAEHKIMFQKALNTKIELHLNIDINKTIAVGSFNYHDNFFTKSFNIRSFSTDKLVSGCTGFGLERFVYAFICQHGIDKNKWPIEINI